VKGKRVLDLSCGNGRLTIPLVEAGAIVTGVDNAEGMLERCRQRLTEKGLEERATLVHCNASKLSLPDQYFDIAICLGLLEHLPRDGQEEAVRNLLRVTRIGGILVFTASNPNSILLSDWQEESRKKNREDNKLRGFHINSTSYEWLQDFLNSEGAPSKVVASNAFLAFALHAFRGSGGKEEFKGLWDSFFQLGGELDIQLRDKGKIENQIAELFMLRAEKVQ